MNRLKGPFFPKEYPGEAVLKVLRGASAHLLGHPPNSNNDPLDIIIGMRRRNASPAMHDKHSVIEHPHLEFLIQFLQIGELLHLRRVPDNGFWLMWEIGPTKRAYAG